MIRSGEDLPVSFVLIHRPAHAGREGRFATPLCLRRTANGCIMTDPSLTRAHPIVAGTNTLRRSPVATFGLRGAPSAALADPDVIRSE
jgi:hypothetical protein